MLKSKSAFPNSGTLAFAEEILVGINDDSSDL